MENIFIPRFQLRPFIHLVCFVVGLSIGISFSVYFKSHLFLSQASIVSYSSLQAQPFILLESPSPPPLLPPPPPPPPPPLPPPAELEVKPNILPYMNDSELFSRAIEAQSNGRSPHKRVPKVAFMFLSRGPMPLGPLWEMFFKGHEGLYTIYVHSHPSFVDSTPENSVFYKRRIPGEVSFYKRTSQF